MKHLRTESCARLAHYSTQFERHDDLWGVIDGPFLCCSPTLCAVTKIMQLQKAAASGMDDAV